MFTPDGGLQGARRDGRPWQLYDEKYLFQKDTAFTGKDSQAWLLDLHNYLAGRTSDLDRMFDYIEKQTEPIATSDIGFMLDVPATMGQVSRQLWALIGGLVKEHSEEKVCQCASAQRLRSMEEDCRTNQ